MTLQTGQHGNGSPATGFAGAAQQPQSRPEYFVDATEGALFLKMDRRTLLQKARQGRIPAHPMGDGPRKTWRFLLSELDAWLRRRVNSDCGAARVTTKGKAK
jgi:hypothetical protein